MLNPTAEEKEIETRMKDMDPDELLGD